MWQIAVDEPAPFELLSPRSLDEAVELAARHDGDCALLAGGTDLLDQLKQHSGRQRYVINLKTIPGLRTWRSPATASRSARSRRLASSNERRS